MRLIDNKCNNCGAQLTPKEDQVLVCEYCGSKYEKADNSEEVVKIVFVPEPPRVSMDIFILLLFLLIVPAFVYSAIVHQNRRSWYKDYGDTNKGQYYYHHKKPQLSYIFMVILFQFGIIPSIIYWMYFRKNLHEWEENLAQFESSKFLKKTEI